MSHNFTFIITISCLFIFTVTNPTIAILSLTNALSVQPEASRWEKLESYAATVGNTLKNIANDATDTIIDSGKKVAGVITDVGGDVANAVKSAWENRPSWMKWGR